MYGYIKKELIKESTEQKHYLARLSGSIKVIHRVLIFVVARFIRDPFVLSSILSIREFSGILEPSSTSSSYMLPSTSMKHVLNEMHQSTFFACFVLWLTLKKKKKKKEGKKKRESKSRIIKETRDI